MFYRHRKRPPPASPEDLPITEAIAYAVGLGLCVGLLQAVGWWAVLALFALVAALV